LNSSLPRSFSSPAIFSKPLPTVSTPPNNFQHITPGPIQNFNGERREAMRPILLGPFGSMGILNMKLRIICIEDMILESSLFFFALIRIATANTNYELWGA
jgi:hypothetical protein